MTKINNKYILYISVITIFIASIYAFYSISDENIPLEKTNKVDIPFTKHGELQIISSKGDTIKKINIEIAEDDFHTQQGLMYRSNLDIDNGMLFIFEDVKERWFYMKNTQIGLDIIYADSQAEIVNIVKDAKPYDKTLLPSDLPAKYVLEINAGLSDKWGVNIGDKLVWYKN